MLAPDFIRNRAACRHKWPAKQRMHAGTHSQPLEAGSDGLSMCAQDESPAPAHDLEPGLQGLRCMTRSQGLLVLLHSHWLQHVNSRSGWEALLMPNRLCRA